MTTSRSALGVASGLALIALLHVAGPARRRPSSHALAMALTALFPPIALWALGGLETLPAALCHDRGRPRAGTCPAPEPRGTRVLAGVGVSRAALAAS